MATLRFATPSLCWEDNKIIKGFEKRARCPQKTEKKALKNSLGNFAKTSLESVALRRITLGSPAQFSVQCRQWFLTAGTLYKMLQ